MRVGATGVGIRVCFAGMFRGMFRGYVSGMFRGIMSYFTCKTGGVMFRGMFRGYVSGYVSRVCNPCALLKPEPPKKQAHTIRNDVDPYILYTNCNEALLGKIPSSILRGTAGCTASSELIAYGRSFTLHTPGFRALLGVLGLFGAF